MDTILLVNDSATLTKVLSAHFQKAGYKVIAVSAVMDAYEAFIRSEIDLILTDYILRDKDGLEVIKTFRTKKTQKALPIVVFTAIGWSVGVSAAVAGMAPSPAAPRVRLDTRIASNVRRPRMESSLTVEPL